jgi:hypothetical protein
MTSSSSTTPWQSIRSELLLRQHPVLVRLLIYTICVGGLVIPWWFLSQRAASRCVLSEQLLVSDPLSKSKSELSSGLEQLGLAGRTDDPTLKAVLESQSVTSAMTEAIRLRHPNDPAVKALLDRINEAKQRNSDDSPLQIKQKRGDRFQDLSIITITVRADSDVLRRIQPDLRQFYLNYGIEYRSERTDKALKFANAQIARLRAEFEKTDQEMQAIRLSLAGFTPDTVANLARDNYARIESALAQSKIDNSEGFGLSSRAQGNLSEIIARNNLQPVITSIPFKRLVLAYNTVRSRQLLLKNTRQPGDQELVAINLRLADLYTQIQAYFKGLPIRPEDIPSTPAAYDAFEREVINQVKIYSLQQQSVKDKQYYSQLAVKAQSLLSRYLYLEEEVKSTISVLATYRQLKEKLLLDSAKELSSWSIIASSLQCQSLPLRLIGVGLTLLYIMIVLLVLSPTLRSLGRRRTDRIISRVHEL